METALQGLLQAAAALHPDRPAVRFDGGGGGASQSYRELLSLAKQLTSLLHMRCPLQDNVAIGLYTHTELNLASWILGILQIPGAYVPIDPDAPAHLSAGVMQQCNLEYVLTQSSLVQSFRDSFSAYMHFEASEVLPNQNLTLVKIKRKIANNPQTGKALNQKVSDKGREKEQAVDEAVQCRTFTQEMGGRGPGCLAYVLHTSGTTGLPKIVRVPHKCIVPNIVHLRSLFQVTPQDVVFMASPLTFDPSVVELFVALSSGASLLLVPTVVKMVPNKLAEVLFKHHRVSIMQATPTLLKRFGSSLLHSTVLSAATPLRVLALGGEAFPSLALLRSWREDGNQTQFFNLYGITEVSCWATCYKIPEEAISGNSVVCNSVPLGMPLLETTVEVRDQNGSVITQGEGQVFIGGTERVCFLGDETVLAPGLMRDTGDWAELRESHMYYMGRKDRVIKRHGKLLNLETLQLAVESLSQVEACAVSHYKEHRLLVFVVAASQSPDIDKVILHSLSKRMPVHGIPDTLVWVEALPLTSHGKVNMEELLKFYEGQRAAKMSQAGLNGRKDLWERLQTLWKDVLSLPEDAVVPSESVFLFCGGDSLKSLRLSEEIEIAVGRSTPGLLEVILSGSFSDLYNHTARLLFPEKDEETVQKTNVKRQLIETSLPTYTKVPKKEETQIQINFLSFTVVRKGGERLIVGAVLHNPACEGTSGNINTLKKAEARHDLTAGHSKEGRNGTKRVEAQPAEKPVSQREDASLKPKVRWKSDTGKCVDASPVLLLPGDGETPATVYIGSHSHRMQAIDTGSGELRWERVLGGRIEASAAVTKCGKFVVVGCYDGVVYFLRADSGESYWMFSTEDSVKSSPCVDLLTGLVFAGSHDGHIYALNTEAKQCVWKRHCGGGGVFSSPCLQDSPRRLYVATLGSQFLAINPDNGDTVWKHSSDKPFFSSPRCSHESVCVGSVDGNIHCFSHAGEKLWQFPTSGPVFSSPCITTGCPADQKLVCGSHDNSVYCLSSRGSLLWRFETSGKVFSSPFSFGGPDWGGQALVAVASTDGTVWIIDVESGTLKTSYSLPGEVFSSPVVWERSLCVGCRNDFVYCLDL
ncbi:beta-alanine-activating enzyme [Amia ocellicauda]|uniref:beta-alanine-activating enzyme n=1 Tax=Amia ocellicauda TaxID=2972642 RepID=UPI003464E3EA